MEDVYVVIVTYNGMPWIDKCITSIIKSNIPVRIILVDNLSTDGTPNFVKNKYPTVIIIDTGQNLGFGKANNIGLKYAKKHKADYIFLINQDVYVDTDSLSGCIQVCKKYKEFGILSPMQMNGDGSMYDKNFGINLNPKNCPSFRDDERNNQIKEIYKINFVMAAFWLLTKDCVNKVGDFDPIFSHYGEDNDYVNRAKFHGFEIGIITNLKIYHDRFFRNVSDEKKLIISYADILSRATNINKNFIQAYCSVILNVGKNFFKAILKASLSLVILNLKLTLKLLYKTHSIIQSRLRNSISKEIGDE